MDAYDYLRRKSIGSTPPFDTWEHLISPCPSGGPGIGSGTIEIEPDRWQMIAIPIQYGYWDNSSHTHIHDYVTPATVSNYIVDQIEDTYGVSAGTMIELFNTYFGDKNKFYNFIPGITDVLSEHNFELAYIDGVNIEYTGLWVKSVHPVSFTIVWGE